MANMFLIPLGMKVGAHLSIRALLLGKLVAGHVGYHLSKGGTRGADRFPFVFEEEEENKDAVKE